MRAGSKTTDPHTGAANGRSIARFSGLRAGWRSQPRTSVPRAAGHTNFTFSRALSRVSIVTSMAWMRSRISDSCLVTSADARQPPTTKVRYSVADTVIAAQEALVEEASGAFLIRAWAEARSVFDVHSGVLLGWYHSHHLLGLMLSVSDEEVNERFFGQPWQASIVVVPDSKSPLGGVFRLYPDGGVAES